MESKSILLLVVCLVVAFSVPEFVAGSRSQLLLRRAFDPGHHRTSGKRAGAANEALRLQNVCSPMRNAPPQSLVEALKEKIKSITESTQHAPKGWVEWTNDIYYTEGQEKPPTFNRVLAPNSDHPQKSKQDPVTVPQCIFEFVDDASLGPGLPPGEGSPTYTGKQGHYIQFFQNPAVKANADDWPRDQHAGNPQNVLSWAKARVEELGICKPESIECPAQGLQLREAGLSKSYRVHVDRDEDGWRPGSAKKDERNWYADLQGYFHFGQAAGEYPEALGSAARKKHLEGYAYMNLWVCFANCGTRPLVLLQNPHGKGELNMARKWWSSAGMNAGDYVIFDGFFHTPHDALKTNPDNMFATDNRKSGEARCRCLKTAPGS